MARFQPFEREYYFKYFGMNHYQSEAAILHIDMDNAKKFTKGTEKTKGMNFPFDVVFRRAMAETTESLCKKIENVVLGYTVSDEINLVLQKVNDNSRPWMNSQICFQASRASVLATIEFNRIFKELAEEYKSFAVGTDEEQRYEVYKEKFDTATFLSNVLPLTRADVVEFLTWRQLSAMRNSISMTAQSFYPAEELLGKSSRELRAMLYVEQHVDWKAIPKAFTRGICCYRTASKRRDGYVKWDRDENIPTFNENPDYINSRFYSFLSEATNDELECSEDE